MDPQTYKRQQPAGFTEDPWKPKPAPDVRRIYLKILRGNELAEIWARDWLDFAVDYPDWWAIWWRAAVPNSKWIDYEWQRATEPESDGEDLLMATIPIRGDEGDYFAIGTDKAGNYLTVASNIVQIRGEIES